MGHTIEYLIKNLNKSFVNPIAVFDGGLGSYDIVKKIHEQYPNENIIYFADRRSFPYGKKSRKELERIIYSTIDYLSKTFLCKRIVVASNAPSIMVLDKITPNFPEINILGVKPPIINAMKISKTKEICILGVESMINDSSLSDYIRSKGLDGKIHINNSSELVELVETGVYVNDKEKTRKVIKSHISKILKKNRYIDVFTLSSTHLPWLNKYFYELFGEYKFLDPADMIISTLPPSANIQKGYVLGLVTENEKYTYNDFSKNLRDIGVNIPIMNINYLFDNELNSYKTLLNNKFDCSFEHTGNGSINSFTCQ